MEISPLRGANSRKRELQMLTHLNWPPQGGYVCKHTAYAAHSQSVPPYLRLLRSDTAICRREDKAQYRDIHLSAWASCLMSGAGLPIYPATPSRKICMRSMKRQTAAIGRSLRNAISRNFKKAVRRGSALRRGNLSLPCPNHSPTSMSRTSCCGFSQTALRKSME